MRRSLFIALVAFLVLAAAACEPSGPGSLTASVEGPVAAGAVVVELQGSGITGIEGAGGTRAFSAAAQNGRHRIVVVGPEAGRLRFRVQVRDLASEPPTGRVVEAVDGQNRPIPSLTAFTVRVAR